MNEIPVGFLVLTLYIDLNKNYNFLENLKREIPTSEIISADLTNWSLAKKAVQQACPIDLLVNNAGVAIIVSLEDANEEQVNQ